MREDEMENLVQKVIDFSMKEKEKAIAKAFEDSVIYGCGFYKITDEGVYYVPISDVIRKPSLWWRLKHWLRATFQKN